MAREDFLIEAVKRLAAAPDEQAAYLRQAGAYPSLDELALEFDDAFAPVRASQGGNEWHEALGRLDAKLDAMSGQQNAQLWRAEALTRDDWAEVRELARGALASR